MGIGTAYQAQVPKTARKGQENISFACVMHAGVFN